MISVIVPVYNVAGYLKESIESNSESGLSRAGDSSDQ